MSTRIFAIAQSASVAGDLRANIERHVRFGEVAAMQGAHFLIFPELSLTGYELDLAASSAVAIDSAELEPLSQLAREGPMTVVASLPLRESNGEISLSAVTFRPSGGKLIYSKQNLHGREKQIFAPGIGGPDYAITGVTIGLAICADIANPQHAADAAQRGVMVYATSVFVSEPGYAEDSSRLSGYAAQHSMAVLMVNHAGETGGVRSAGRSAIWAAGGELVAQCPDNSEALLFGKRISNGSWEAWQAPVSLPMPASSKVTF
jgi:predicted amidohydrolase